LCSATRTSQNQELFMTIPSSTTLCMTAWYPHRLGRRRQIRRQRRRRQRRRSPSFLECLVEVYLKNIKYIIHYVLSYPLYKHISDASGFNRFYFHLFFVRHFIAELATEWHFSWLLVYLCFSYRVSDFNFDISKAHNYFNSQSSP